MSIHVNIDTEIRKLYSVVTKNKDGAPSTNNTYYTAESMRELICHLVNHYPEEEIVSISYETYIIDIFKGR